MASPTGQICSMFHYIYRTFADMGQSFQEPSSFLCLSHTGLAPSSLAKSYREQAAITLSYCLATWFGHSACHCRHFTHERPRYMPYASSASFKGSALALHFSVSPPTIRHSRSSQLYSKFSVSSSPLTQGRPSRHKLSPEFLANYRWHCRLDRYDSRLGFFVTLVSHTTVSLE